MPSGWLFRTKCPPPAPVSQKSYWAIASPSGSVAVNKVDAKKLCPCAAVLFATVTTGGLSIGVVQGSSLVHAQEQAFAWVGQQVQAQAAYLAYIDVFWTLMLISAGASLLAFVLRKVKLGAPAPVGH